MSLPYMRYPFISQNEDTVYSQQQPDYSGMQYTDPYLSAPQYYPPMSSYDIDEEYDTYDISESRQPQPQLSNNPATARITLFKELTAFPNYGNPSRNADILYTGNRGTWTFDSPAFLFVPGNQRARIVIRVVLDDHFNVPVNRYTARIIINGTVVHNGRVPAEHGTPAGGMFNNWREMNLNVPNLRRNNRVVIENTSTTGPNDWIGLDWMEMRLVPR